MMHASIRIFWNGPLLRKYPLQSSYMDSNQIAIAGWLTQQFEAKILRIGKNSKDFDCFLSLVTACDCFLLWGRRFSLPKAHHFKYPPSEAVWTISLKVRSLAKFWLKSRLPQGLQTSDLTEELAARVPFLLSSSKPHRGRILSMDLAVKLKLRNT